MRKRLSRIDPYISLPLSGEVPRRGGWGTEGAFGMVLNSGALASSTSSVSLSLDSSPYKGKPCGVHTFIISRGGYQPPANVAIGTVSPGEASIAFPL